MLKRIALIIGIVVVLAAAGFTIWASTTNPLMPSAENALNGNASVQVRSAGDRLVFEPAGKQTEAGLIFYPGGKVDYRAYAPYAQAVAEQGYLVVIEKMPLNLAVFNPGAAAKDIRDFPEVKYWAVGGHSLGGSMAANFAASNPGQVSGLVLLASYPAGSDDLSGSSLRVVSISASNDGLATPAKIDASRSLLPRDAKFIQIEGGNHAQFGDYGVQSGDGAAKISRAEQQQQAVAATVALLQEISSQTRK